MTLGIVLVLLIGLFYNLNTIKKLTPQENSKVISIVNSYYNSMKNKNYNNALDLIDYRKLDYNKDFSTLKGLYGYNISPILENNNWVIPNNGKYDFVSINKESNCYVVEICAYITYKNTLFEATEDVHLKKIGKDYKIINIITDDKYGYVRGSYIRK